MIGSPAPALRPTSWWGRERATPLGIFAAGLAAMSVQLSFLGWVLLIAVDSVDVRFAPWLHVEPVYAVVLASLVTAGVAAATLGVIAVGQGRSRGGSVLGWVGAVIGPYVVIKSVSDPIAVLVLDALFAGGSLYGAALVEGAVR